MRNPLTLALRNKAPIPYTGRHQIRLPWSTKTGAEQQMRAMGSVGTLFAIVDRLCTSTSAVEWKLYRQGPPGQDPDERTEVTRHAALDIWRKPNPFMTRQELVESFQQHLDLVGEGWLVIARNWSIPMELWPVRPDRIEPVPDAKNFLKEYLYTGPDGQQITLALNDVIQLRRPNPLDPYRGMGAVQTILTDLEGVKFSAEWNRNFFMNSAEPGGIVEVDRRLSDDEFDELAARWREQHQGVANAHRVAILEQGKWVDRKYSMRDMQFTELRTVSREIIREAFGIPKFAIGDVEDVNRATAEASKAWFAEQLTVPRLERIKQALNNDYLPMFGPTGVGVEFDYCNPVPLDREADDRERDSKVAAFVALVAAGVEPEDAASTAGLPRMQITIAHAPEIEPAAEEPAMGPREVAELIQKIYQGVDAVVTWEEAREILVQAGAPLDLSLPQPEEPEPPALPPGRPAAPGGPADPPAIAPAARARTRALPARSLSVFDLARDRAHARPSLIRGQVVDDETEDEHHLAGVRQDLEAALAVLLERWAPILDAQIDQLGDQVEAAINAGAIGALATMTVNTDDAAELLRGALAGMATTAADRMVAEAAAQGVTVAVPALDRRLTNVLPGRVVNFGGQLVDIATATAALLGSGLASTAGKEAVRLWSPGSLGRAVADRVKNFLRGISERGRRDALGGAMHRATNLGRLAVLDSAPTATYWAREVNDQNRCEPCEVIDGYEFESVQEAYTVYGLGGYPGCLGGDRCRGTVDAIWPSGD